MIKLQKDFLTIKKKEYSHFAKRNVIRVTRFFDKKTDILSPTIQYVTDPTKCQEAPDLKKTYDMQVAESSPELRERFAENIRIQEGILNIVKKRNEQYNYRCGLIRLTTGKGKSHVVIDITKYYNTNTLVLVHNVATQKEMIEKFEKFSSGTASFGQYGGGKKTAGNITICTKASFINDWEYLRDQIDFSCIICDEAEMGFSKKFWESMNKFCYPKKGIAFYGLTGTPVRDNLNTQDLERYFGKLIEIKGQENNGYNLIPNFSFYDYYTTKMYEYELPHEMRECLEEDEDRMRKLCETAFFFHLSRKCTLIMSDRKSEIDAIQANLENRTKGEAFIYKMTGETKTTEDESNKIQAEAAVLEGRKVIIVATIQKAGRGVDIPFIDGAFIAAAIKFEGTIIQAVGRALRKYPGKTEAKIAVWNDMSIYKKQRGEKMRSIISEYPVSKADIQQTKLGQEKSLF